MSEIQTDLIGKRVQLCARRYGDWCIQGIGIVRMLSTVDGYPYFLIEVEGGKFEMHSQRSSSPNTLLAIHLKPSDETHWSMTVIGPGKPLKAPSASPTEARSPSGRMVRTDRDLNGNITGIDVYSAGAWRSIRDSRHPLIQRADIPDLIAALQEQL